MRLRAGLKLLSLRRKVLSKGRRLASTKKRPSLTKGRVELQPVRVPNTLQGAILFRQEVSFYYTDTDGSPTGLRRGYPHAMWREGVVTYVHMWVLPGSVSEGRLPGWRTFKSGAIRQLTVRENPLRIGNKPAPFTLAPGWNPSYYRRVGTPIAIVK